MADFAPILAWIEAQQTRMESLVMQWAAINSGSYNIAGLSHMADVLTDAFAVLRHPVRRMALPPQIVIESNGEFAARPLGPALFIQGHPQRANRVLMGIHFDTVYGAESTFQQVRRCGQEMCGPGVADAKGGIAILLIALQALEESEFAGHLGWDVVLNPDEEIGSPGSAPLYQAAAQGKTLGLLFEPALPDGSLAAARKGSGNFVWVVRGKAAHAGRDFHSGRSSTVALAKIVLALDQLNNRWPGATINIGRVEGGSALNIVPDLAIARVNIRCQLPEHQQEIHQALRAIAEEANKKEGFDVQLHGEFHAPPRIFDPAHAQWFNRLAQCGAELAIPVSWQDSGGTCDGNRLSAGGLPTIDTLGPVGQGIHSFAERIDTTSLAERAKLTALMLLKVARGDF